MYDKSRIIPSCLVDEKGGTTRIHQPRASASHTSATCAERNCATAISFTTRRSWCVKLVMLPASAAPAAEFPSRTLRSSGRPRFAQPVSAKHPAALDARSPSHPHGIPSKSFYPSLHRASSVRVVCRGIPAVIYAARRSPMEPSHSPTANIAVPSASQTSC